MTSQSFSSPDQSNAEQCDVELSLEELTHAAGGFDPQPEPPRQQRNDRRVRSIGLGNVPNQNSIIDTNNITIIDTNN